MPLLVLKQIRRNAKEIRKEETQMTPFDLIAFTDGPFQSKAGSVLKRATFHCNVCRNLFSTSFAEPLEISPDHSVVVCGWGFFGVFLVVGFFFA